MTKLEKKMKIEDKIEPGLREPSPWRERTFTPMGLFPMLISALLLILYTHGWYKMSKDNALPNDR